jgi:hypothetical protein
MLSALSLPTSSPLFAAAFSPVTQRLSARGDHSDDWILDESAGIDVRGLLTWYLLGDQRQAPAELVDQTIKGLGLDLAGSAIAPDLRLCDLALASIIGSIATNEKKNADMQRHLLSSPLVERDEIIAKQRLISEAKAKTIAAALGGGAETFKQWGLISPASDF